MKRTIMMAAIAAASVSALAQPVLYEQLPHTPGAAGGNGTSVFRGVLSGAQYDRLVADDFTVPAPGWNVTHVTAHYVTFNNATDPTNRTFNIEVFQKGANGPTTLTGTVIAAQGSTVTNGGTYFGRTERIVLINVADTALQPGEYYITIQPTYTPQETADNWFWLTSTPTTPLRGTPIFITSRSSTDTVGYPFNAWGPGRNVFGADYDQAFKIHGTTGGGGPQTFDPTSFNIVRGALEAGALSDILRSDDLYLRVRNGAIALPAESPITIDFIGTSPVATGSALGARVENRVSIGGLAQRIQMRRYEGTPGFVQVDELIPAPTVDTVRNVNAPAPVADFIQDSDRQVTARLLVRAAGPLFTNTWRTFVDEVEFTVSP